MLKVKEKLVGILSIAFVLIAMATPKVYADLTIAAGETFTLSAGETLAVNGDLTIANTGVLDASAGSTTVSLSGDWTNNGEFTDGAGTVTLDGTSTQTLSIGSQRWPSISL